MEEFHSAEQEICSQPKKCRKDFKLNALGAGISFLCLIHCLATPFALVVFSTLTFNFYHGFDYVFFGAALIVILIISRRSEHFWIKSILWSGAVLVTISLLFGYHQHSADWMLISGSGLLVTGHVLNLAIHNYPGFFNRVIQKGFMNGVRSKGH